MPRFAFRMRAYSAAHLDWDTTLRVTWPYAEAIFQSEYAGGDDGRAYPVTLHAEIRGEGEGPADVEPKLAAAVGNVLPLISVATNAAIATPLPVAFHGLDLQTPQPFIGYETPRSDAWFPPGRRVIDAEATLAWLTAVGNHESALVLMRAAESYRRALAHWFPEEMLMAGEFLFIAAETLSRFLLEERAAAAGVTPKVLARNAGKAKPDALRNEILEREVFAGDVAALEAMRAASNGFEHGYMGPDDVRGLMGEVLERSMAHVRRALIRAVHLPDASEARLLAGEYEEPRGLVPTVRTVHGALRRTDASRPAPDLDVGAVELDWRSDPPSVTRHDDGQLELKLVVNVAVRCIPDNVSLDVGGFGLRAANVLPTGETRAVADLPGTLEPRA